MYLTFLKRHGQAIVNVVTWAGAFSLAVKLFEAREARKEVEAMRDAAQEELASLRVLLSLSASDGALKASAKRLRVKDATQLKSEVLIILADAQNQQRAPNADGSDELAALAALLHATPPAAASTPKMTI
jgi:hypothetical protein